ncbi:PAP/fibrillin family protein [Leptolyngbya sp. O-77]|uniref:PAP/fibrillin family protein n=1 Tax=Leptolyngbya sp. O-77 TaxID=1080068 RepID=UPI00074D47DA|nr:PAP/fibrillin family protein [Leptolyngbya sp. O-77]BAU41650.1 PAP_fibrillin [Leptolyngbya sp. O-77]
MTLGKAELLQAIAGKNRGLLASEADNLAILAAVARLEEFNPTPRPLEAADKLDGNWRLLYTTSTELLGIGRFPVLRLGQIYQCIRVKTQQVFNIAEVTSLPLLEGLVSVAARFDPVSDRRVDVGFERGIFGLQRLIGYRNPSQFIQDIQSGKRFAAADFRIDPTRRKGWLEITYLDDDLRIGRGNEGSVFVLTRV